MSANESKEMDQLINTYSQRRKLKYENKLVDNKTMYQTDDDIVRIMSYNILADGNNYALGKWLDYCPHGNNGDRLAYRKWSYRGERILAQIKCYLPDIICLQETVENTFRNYLEPQLKLIGYNGIHGIRDIIAAKQGNFDQMTDAMFFNINKFKLIDFEILRIDEIAKINKNNKYTKYFGDYTQNYPYLNKLTNRCDICIIAHLQFIKTNKPLIALNSHLLWDNAYAHTIVSQCFIINNELNHIITNKWKLNINNIPIVFGIDANSNVFKSQYDVFYNPNNPVCSGVYQLMTSGTLSKQHIDHPYTRCKLFFQSNNTNNNDEKTDTIQSDFAVNLSGLPYSAKDKEIKDFFKHEKITKINIIFNYGKPSGCATVEFKDENSLNTALKKHKNYIGNRYIEVTALHKTKPKVNKNDIKTKSNNNKQRFVIKMIGLPYSAREKEITEFFKDENISEIIILFLNDGRAAGEALVEFNDEKSLKNGMLKNRGFIGKRYVELVMANGNEIDVACGRINKEFIQPDIDDWKINIEWKSGYKNGCGYEPLLTCKSPDYFGVSDYIFINQNCETCAYLELPYHDEKLKCNQQSVEQFPNLPNKMDPSDHLPIVCDVKVTYKNSI
eukprot:155114_1